MKNTKLIILILLTTHFSLLAQIEYDKSFNVPGEEFGGSNPRDIVYVDNHIYIYSYNRLLIFDESKNYQGKIEMSNLGRFAPRFNLPGWYVPDAKMMVADPTGHQLFFVTPSLKVLRIETDTVDLVPDTVLTTPPAVYGKNLHGYTKLEFDNSENRLFWLIDVQNSNYHSWNSYFGVYKKTQGNNTYNNIYAEFKNGSNPVDGYLEVVQTFEYNPHNNDFYLSRKMKIDVMRVVNNNSVVLQRRIPTTTPRTSKMVLVDDGTPHYLMTFPAYLPSDDYFQTPDTLKIYQINTTNFNDVKTIDAPNKMVTDAIYLADKNHLVTSFVNYQPFYQSDAVNKDFAVYNYTNGTLSFKQALNTNSSTEMDTTDFSKNISYSILKKSDGKLFLSKKNEIIEITPQTTGSYTFNQKYYAKDSYFGKGTQTSSNVFVINNVSSGLDYFTSGFHGRLETGYPTFNIVSNPVNRKLYLFNRLSNSETGFYTYNLESGVIDNYIETEDAIGDLVYNSFKNEIVVSAFGTTGKIRIYSGESDTVINTISFTGRNYCGRMFIAPNNKLYVSANMRVDNSYTPKLIVLDATDYFIDKTLDIPLTENDTIAYNLRSHFCYNPFNEKVYVTFSHYRCFSPPYQTSFHASAPDINDPTEAPFNNYGVLISINNKNIITTISTGLNNVGELICSNPDTASGDYKGTVYVAAEKLKILNCENDSLFEQDSIYNIVDMDYSPRTNCLYVYSHKIDGSGTEIDTNRIRIHKVEEDGSFHTIWQENGFGASLTYNPYDGRLYFYKRNDMYMMEESPMKVFLFDAENNSNVQLDSVHLPLYSFMPEMVHQTITPWFDLYGKAYFPNGMHSNVSVLNFSGGSEALHLTSGTNWISIPRIDSNRTVSYWDSTRHSIVFNRNRFAIPYSTLVLKHNRVWSSNSEQNYFVDWKEIISDWSFDPNEPDNQNALSYRGYTLELDPDTNNTLYMYGQVKDPSTTFPLYKDKKNWIGYFLPVEQDVFDALADHLDSITEIWHRTYYCYRPNGGSIIFGPEGGGVLPPSGPEWACTSSNHRIKYGEMIKVHPIGNLLLEEDDPFYWCTGSHTDPNAPRQTASYYTYEEKAMYKPIIIELDTTPNPEEIGAFVNDTCVGACTVIEADTAVILMAYLEGQSPDSIEFREYSGTKSVRKNQINRYLVLDEKTGLYENRKLHTHEGNNRACISLKHKKKTEVSIPSLRFNIWPNPANGMLYYSCLLIESATLDITIYDLAGKLMNVKLSNHVQSGYVQGSLDLKTNTGEQLKPGVYFVNLNTGKVTETKKIIVQ